MRPIIALFRSVRLAARARLRRSFAVIGASVALLSGVQSLAAAPACPGSEIVTSVTRPGIVGWTVRIDKSPKCAFPSLVVVMDLIEAGRKVHKFSFTLQYDVAKDRSSKRWVSTTRFRIFFTGRGQETRSRSS